MSSLCPVSVFAAALTFVQDEPSKNAKIERLRAAVEPLDTELAAKVKFLFHQALSPYVTFGIKALPSPDTKIPVDCDTEHRYSYVLNLFSRLAARALTGNEAKEAVKLVLSLFSDQAEGKECTPREAVRRVLLKDLRAGMTESTANKAWPGLVPVFECQLAASEMPAINDLTYPVIVEPKYDGVRVVAIKRSGVVTLYSRNGIPFENFEEIRSLIEAKVPDNIVLDGEILHRDQLGDAGYRLLMKRAKAAPGKSVDIPIRYQVFDFMKLADWDSKAKGFPQIKRTEFAAVVTETFFDPNDAVSMAPGTYAKEPDDLQRYYLQQVEAGFEGVIVKDPEAPYRWKRGKSWQKLKPFDTKDFVVTGYFEGEGKYAGMLGGLSVEGVDKDGSKIETNVGSGYVDAQRKEFWEQRDSLIGRHVEIRYQDISIAEGATVKSLRFPTFQRFRAADEKGKV